MAFSLIADGVFDSIYDIDTDALVRRGVTLLLADLDNTIAPYSVSMPTDEMRAWKGSLENCGITLFILSNSHKPNRVRTFAEALNVPFLGRAGKPKAAGFHRAMTQMGRTAAQSVMVGDQIFTDVLGAKNAGMPVLLVRPIRLAGNPGRYLRYALELPFRLLAKGRRL